MRSLLVTSSYNNITAAVIDRLGAKCDPDTGAHTTIKVGSVESAEPAAELWALAQLVTRSPALTAAFDVGSATAERLHNLGTEADTFNLAFAAFLARFGARGPDEWELA